MLKVVIGYPKKEEEQSIIRQNIASEKKTVLPILSTADIIKARKIVEEVYLDEKIEKYIVDHYEELEKENRDIWNSK
jgi:MoxR-like ATPase